MLKCSGAVASSRHQLHNVLVVTIWVETPRGEQLRRGLEHNGGEARDYWIPWIRDEDRFRTGAAGFARPHRSKRLACLI